MQIFLIIQNILKSLAKTPYEINPLIESTQTHTMEKGRYYKEKIDNCIQKYSQQKDNNLYAPVNYILALNSKRVRSSLFLHSCDMFDLSYKQYIFGALALEFFHNFTLVHDDIMDQAPLRRGKKSVHEKWDLNTGILAGDCLITEAYSHLHKLSSFNGYDEICCLFSDMSISVCQGQKMDLNFEKRERISLEEYLLMVELKTATLIACSLKMGALLANQNCNGGHLYKFGKNIGIAFQLQDDMLDIYSSRSGKTKGGDILLSKKTLPFVLALKYGNQNQQETLCSLYQEFPANPKKVIRVLALYKELNIKAKMLSSINEYYRKAFLSLDLVNTPKKDTLLKYVKALQNRFS